MDILKLFLAFLVGGLICALIQLLIDITSLSPAKIMVLLVVFGVFLGAVGLYEPIFNAVGAGISVPLIGFGGNVAKNEKRNARNGALYVARRLFRKERAPVVFQRFGVKFKERPKEKKENGALAKKTLAARPTPQTLQKNDYLRMPRRLMSVT